MLLSVSLIGRHFFSRKNHLFYDNSYIYVTKNRKFVLFVKKNQIFFVDFVQFVENCDILIMGIGIIGN